jgi:hypothetical protein
MRWLKLIAMSILKGRQSERYVLTNAQHVSELSQRLLHFEYWRL